MNPATAATLQNIALAKRPARAAKPSCEDCFFHQNQLCALNAKKACPTFRPASEGLKPPQQLTFAFRQERTRSAWVFKQPS